MLIRRHAFLLLAFVSSSAVAACSLLLDHDAPQCATDGDCKHFAQDAVCVDGACKSPPDGGLDAPATDGNPPPDGPRDGGADALALGPPGCFNGTPTTDLDFFNACTNASYLTFDNCARLGVCNGGGPSLLDPPLVDSGTSPGIDGGPADGCYALAQPNVIYMQGSTNFTPFIQAMVPLVAQANYKIVWQPTSSCAGAGAAFDATKTLMKNPTTTATAFASAYEADGGATPCMLGDNPNGPGNGAEVTDIGESDIYGDTCDSTWSVDTHTDVGHYTGPIQIMVFVAPPASSQRVISAEAAREVFGIGGNSDHSKPWIDPTYMFIRSSTTGTNNIISLGINVPAKKWWGIDKKTAGNMRDSIITVDPGSSEKTIGILSMDFANKAKQNLHILAFQAKGQIAGFLPDEQAATNDKINVRDGHYPLWGPIHIYTKLSGGLPSPQASAFINQFALPKPDQELLDATIATGNVPVCAMKVTRSSEMGPLSPFTPGFGCGCYFEFKVNGGTNCTKCNGPADCPASRPSCNIGYCEVQ